MDPSLSPESVRFTDWLPLLLFPGSVVIFAVVCFVLFVGLVRQGRNLEAAVALVAFLGVTCVIWMLYGFFIAS